MSGEGEYQNYSEINLNAIKNTKLFQKFMQNKSGLISSGSSSILSNPKRQNQQAQAQEAQVVRQKKWAKNRNANKVPKIQQVQQNRDEKQISNKKQDSIIIPTKNKFEPQVVPIQKPIENNETVRIRGFEKQQVTVIDSNIIQNQRNQIQTQFGQRVQQNQVQMSQNNPPVPNRRKRNFNPNFQSSRSHHQPLQQKPKAQFEVHNNEANLNEQQHKSVSYVSSFGIKNISEPFPQNNINLYNTVTVRQQNFMQQDQKQPKAQIQPHRNQYPHNYTFNEPKISVSEPNPSLQSTTVPQTITQTEYKQKYESLLKRYQQLKHDVKNQNKNRKKQLTEWQQQIDMVKQKLFDVQSREDSLLIQNHRLKQKWQSQNLLKMKTQQENKQLGYKIKQLQDQLAMRDNHMKQKVDETNYWKAQADGLKQELHGLKLNFQKRNDQYNLLLGDYQIVKRERDNKDFLLEDLRRNIAFLVEENSAAKDQIFKLVTKLYQLQQENQVLRSDIKRQSLDHSQLNNYMKDLQQQSRDRIQSTNIQRHHHQRQYQTRNQHLINKNQSFVLKQTIPRNSFPEQEKPNAEKQTRRRGEFARERGQLTRNERAERDQRPIPTSQNTNNTLHVNIPQQRQQIMQKNPQFANNNKVARMTEIAQELDKIRDMKAMNGAIRRKRIQLERELQELESQ